MSLELSRHLVGKLHFVLSQFFQRIATVDATGKLGLLCLMLPWMSHVKLCRETDREADQLGVLLMWNLCDVTFKLMASAEIQVTALWQELAKYAINVPCIAKFLLKLGVQ